MIYRDHGLSPLWSCAATGHLGDDLTVRASPPARPLCYELLRRAVQSTQLGAIAFNGLISPETDMTTVRPPEFRPLSDHGRRRRGAKNTTGKTAAIVVPGGGVEPPRPEGRRILSPLRLPVPPSRRLGGLSIVRQPLRILNTSSVQISATTTGIRSDRLRILRACSGQG